MKPVVILFFIFGVLAQQNYFTCYIESDGSLKVSPGKDTNGIAWGYYEDTIISEGYGILSIATNASYDDKPQMLCAGYLEGILTQANISNLFQSFFESTFTDQRFFDKLYAWTKENIAWTKSQVKANPFNQYWIQVGLVMEQLNGLWMGYNQQSTNPLEEADLYLLNMLGDLDDLIPALQYQQNSSFVIENIQDYVLNSHCSCLVRLNSDFSELYAAHEMWSSYYQLYNVYKHYDFGLSSNVNGKVSFSSYPGLLSSEDDFYILGSQLVVMETTNAVFNLSIYSNVVTSSLMSWVRVIVSNRLAVNAPSWTQIMSRYNSGTYNNQWIIVDYNLFTPGMKQLLPNTLWIGSQLPGYFFSLDVTETINQQGYWASYNVPFIPQVFNLAGYPSMVQKYGDLWTFDECPRAQLFRRLAPSIETVEDVQHFMRRNKWQSDPESLKCPLYCIASRLDLSPSNYTGECAPAAFGAINAKMTQASWVESREASIIGGPTNQDQPPFEWTPEISAQFSNTKHYGQSSVFNYQWLNVSPKK